MSSFAKVCATLCLMALPISAVAQDSTADEPAAADTAEASDAAPATEAPSATDDLPLGASEVGSVYIAETFGDWALRCVRSDGGNDPCQLYQLLKDDNDTPVSEISIFTVASGGQAVAGATVITPLETLLTANLRMAVDAGNSKVYPFVFCSRKGCHSRLGFTQEDIASFQKGAVATIAIVPAAAPDQRVNLTVSLSGFTAGWNALVAANAAARGE